MQSGGVCHLWEDDVAGLRHARRRRPVPGPGIATLLLRHGAGPSGAVVPALAVPGVAVTDLAPTQPSVPAPRSPRDALTAPHRFEAVDTLGLGPVSTRERWRTGWTRRHTFVTAAATPALTVGYAAALGLGEALGTWSVVALLGLAGAIAAATLATYLPAAKRGAAALTMPCAAGALVFVPLAALPLTSAGPATGRALAAVGLVALGLLQQFVGVAACPR